MSMSNIQHVESNIYYMLSDIYDLVHDIYHVLNDIILAENVVREIISNCQPLSNYSLLTDTTLPGSNYSVRYL